MSLWREIMGLPPKPKPIAKRGFAAAKAGRLFMDFMSSSKSADVEMKGDLVLMRNRARELARDDPYVKQYLRLLKDNVVGENGFALQVKARNTNGLLDDIGNGQIEAAWAAFGRLGNCTADGKRSFVGLTKYVIEALARDGEVFIQIVRNRAFYHGIAFHAVEADLIDENKNEKAKNGNEIRMGIEVDRFQRPVAYWVRQKHPGDYDWTTYDAHQSVRVPAENMIHVFDAERAGQSRGTTWLGPFLTTTKMLNAYREAELVAARMAAAKMGFFTSDSGEDVPADTYDNNVPVIDAEPGTFHQLPNGVDFKTFDTNHPSTAFSDFEKGILRGMAVGGGVSYASLSGDLADTSYSSVRQGALMERDAFRGMQKLVMDHFIMPAFAVWLRHVMEFGFIPLPATRFEKFFSATTFRPRGWQWVDPKNEITAAVMAMHNGVMSPQDVSSQYGRDIEETYSQYERDMQLAQQFGLELAFLPFGGAESAKGVPEAVTPEPAPARAIEQHPPTEVVVRVQQEQRMNKRKMVLIRDEDGTVTGAEAIEETD